MIFFGRMGPTALPVVARSGKYHHEAHDKNLVVVAPRQPIPPAFRRLSAQSRVAASQRSARGQQALHHTHDNDDGLCAGVTQPSYV
jgi:hypothetical protein